MHHCGSIKAVELFPPTAKDKADGIEVKSPPTEEFLFYSRSVNDFSSDSSRCDPEGKVRLEASFNPVFLDLPNYTAGNSRCLSLDHSFTSVFFLLSFSLRLAFSHPPLFLPKTYTHTHVQALTSNILSSMYEAPRWEF